MKRLLIAVIIFLCILPFTPYLKKAYWAQEELDIHTENRKNERMEEYMKPKTQTGTVTGVPDGKSIIVKTSNGENKMLHLKGIELPADECFKQKSRIELYNIIINSIVSMECETNGDFCIIRNYEEQDIGSLMLWNGFAKTASGSYFSKTNEYLSLEKQALTAKRGFWSGKCEN